MALLAKVLVMTVPHVLSHGHINMGISPCDLDKLVMDLHVTQIAIRSMFSTVQFDPWSAVSTIRESVMAAAPRDLGVSGWGPSAGISWYMPTGMGQGGWEAGSAVRSPGGSQLGFMGLQGLAHAYSDLARSPWGRQFLA